MSERHASAIEEFDADDVMVAIRLIANDNSLFRKAVVDEIRRRGGSEVPSSAAERKSLFLAASRATSSSADRTAFAAGRKIDKVDLDIAIRIIANDPSIIRKTVAEAKRIGFQ